MIYDRTIQDVNEAKRIIREKIKSFLELTREEIEKLERGVFTIESANRIESKQEEIKLLLNSLGYYNNSIDNKKWSFGDYFMQSDLDRIVNNLTSLKNSFMVYEDTPKSVIPIYHFEEINKIEKILVDLEKMANEIVGHYRECGTFDCGGG